MVDFHSHILPSIDDGARDINETFNLLKEAYNAGFNKIISTSHYYLGHYENDEETRKKYINVINKKIKNLGYNLEIYNGSEIFITSEMTNVLKNHKASSINGSKYVLFELPFTTETQNLKEVIYSLMGNNYIPIIAHPERYEYVQQNPNILLELLDIGVLFQSNFGSIIGQYGKNAQKTVKSLLKNKFIHFLGSDSHRENTIYEEIPNALKKLEEIITEKEIEELTCTNPKLVLNDKLIYTRRPIKIKKRFFGF